MPASRSTINQVPPQPETTNFCQEPSSKYLKQLEEEGGDPRSVAGKKAIEDGSWAPTYDSRDARIVKPEGN